MDLEADLATEWGRCRDWLLPAFERGRMFFSEADIIDGLVSGENGLYAGKESAVVYTVTEYPQSKAFVFLIAGGDLQELARIEPILIEKAKDLGCDHVQYCGRRGWLRALNYKEIFCLGFKEVK